MHHANCTIHMVSEFILGMPAPIQRSRGKHMEAYIVLHEPHACIAGPTLAIVVAHDVFVVGVRVLREISLNQILQSKRRQIAIDGRQEVI